MGIDILIQGSDVSETAVIYKSARVINSRCEAESVIGEFSRVKESVLMDNVRIDRNNYIENSSIDRFSYTGMNSVVMHSDIGSFCSISWNVTIGGANHDYSRVAQHSFLYNDRDRLRPGNVKGYDRFSQKLTIGNDVWIASGAVVTRGVSIGDGAVVGANAVVTRDVPPFSIVVGSPARVIGYRFSDEVIELLLELKWWDWSKEKITESFQFLNDKPDVEKLRKLLS